MTTSQSSVNLISNDAQTDVTQVPSFVFSDEVNYNQTLHPETPYSDTNEGKIFLFKVKFPSVYRSFIKQQERDLMEFIKVYSSKHEIID